LGRVHGPGAEVADEEVLTRIKISPTLAGGGEEESVKAYTRFGVLPSLSHDIGDASKAERPLPQITINRIAEKAANYSPHAEWDNDVQRFRDLMERST
jgi:hypothetical protein